MVDVSQKRPSVRFARAAAFVRMRAQTAAALRAGNVAKGDALTAAQLAGVLAAKRTAGLIPLAHPLPLAHVDVTFAWQRGGLRIESTAKTSAATGVELEAMCAAAIAALTIYDMAKSLERGIAIESITLLEKSGGKSGRWRTKQR